MHLIDVNNPKNRLYVSKEVIECMQRIPPIAPESIRLQTVWVDVYDKLPSAGERVLATDGAFVGEMYINKRGQWTRYNDVEVIGNIHDNPELLGGNSP